MSHHLKRFSRLIKNNHYSDSTWIISYIGIAFLSIVVLFVTTFIAIEDNKNHTKSKETFKSWTHNIDEIRRIFKSDQPLEDLLIKLQFKLDYSKELPNIETSILSIKKIINNLNNENNHHKGTYFIEAKNILDAFNTELQRIQILIRPLFTKTHPKVNTSQIAYHLKTELYHLRNLIKKFNNVKIKECLTELDTQIKQNTIFNNRRLWVTALFIFLICCMLLQNYRSHQRLNKEILARKEQEKLLAETAERANQLAKIAQEANETKSNFLANISHEIRTPMNGIVGMTNLLKSTSLNIDQKDYLNTISYSANILLNIINDLLDVSKIESGKIVIENIELNLRHLIEEVLVLMAPLVYQKQLFLYYSIPTECPEYLIGDPIRLRQILINLVGNAIKFTSVGGITIEVNMINSTQDNVLLKIMVNDTGIGIEKTKQNLIFERFIQADNSTTRKYGGTGLGLSICKQLTELMGGEIKIESEIGQGSQFILSLPLLKSNLNQNNREPLNEEVFLVSELSSKYTRPLIEKCGCRVNQLQWSDPHLHNKINLIAPESIIVFSNENLNTDFKNTAALVKNKELYSLWITHENNSPDFTPLLDEKKSTIHLPIKLDLLYNSLKKIKLGNSEQIPETSETHQKINLNRKILLAEDNPINQKIAKKVLENWNCEVCVVENGRLACELLDQQPFDLILMDCQMPIMDGFEATQLIRAKEEKTSTHIPIIAMTANARIEDKEQCLNTGMDEYISKPFDHDELYRLILKFTPLKTERSIKKSSHKKIIDIEKLQKNFDGNTDFILEILTEYQKSTEESIKNLQQCYNQQNWESMSRLLHSLKGSSKTVCAEEISEIFVDLEDHLRKNQTEELKKIFLNIFPAFDKVKYYINQVYNKEKAK